MGNRVSFTGGMKDVHVISYCWDPWCCRFTSSPDTQCSLNSAERVLAIQSRFLLAGEDVIIIIISCRRGYYYHY